MRAAAGAGGGGGAGGGAAAPAGWRWQRRRRRQRGGIARVSTGSSLAAAAALFVAAAAAAAIATPAEASSWFGGGGGGRRSDPATAGAVADWTGAAAAAATKAAATTEGGAGATAGGGARSLQQQQEEEQAAAAATSDAEADALAAAVAAAAAEIDPPMLGTAADATPPAFVLEDATGGGGGSDAAAAAVSEEAAAAIARAAAETFVNNVALVTDDQQQRQQQWQSQLGGEEEGGGAAAAAAAADPTATAAADDGDAGADAGGPPLRPVEGAAAYCSPEVGNGGALLVSSSAADPQQQEQQQQQQQQQVIRCRLFRRVCADHDSLVLYSPRHNPRHPSFRSPAPPLELPGVRADYHSCDGAWGTAFAYPPPLVRPATPGEESDDLASPAFSRCTVPVVLFPSSLYELGDFFRNTVATLRGLQLAGLLDRRMTPVVATLGMRLEPWHYFLLRPFAALGATTLSRLSSRLPREAREPYSPDGTHVRCFSQLLACPTPRFWAPAATAAEVARAAEAAAAAAADGRRHLLLASSSSSSSSSTSSSRRGAQQQQKQQQQKQKQSQHPPLWATYQDVLEHYRPELPADGGIPPPGPGAPPEDPLYPLALNDPSKLRVIVAAHRSRAARARLLNQEQVWSWCTKFVPPPGVGKGWNGTACALHEFGRDLKRDLALAARADALIAMHGPDLYLGALPMARRSSVIEIRPYGFNATSDPRADAYFRAPLRAEGDALFWWGVDVEDASASRPGQRELEGRGDRGAWPRDRHATMRLVPLQYLMERVALTRRDLDRYRGFRARGQSHVSDAAPPRILGLQE